MSIPNWPGTGDIPEPEDEGLRDELIEKEEERRLKKIEDQQARSKEQKDFYTGKSGEATDDETTPEA